MRRRSRRPSTHDFPNRRIEVLEQSGGRKPEHESISRKATGYTSFRPEQSVAANADADSPTFAGAAGTSCSHAANGIPLESSAIPVSEELLLGTVEFGHKIFQVEDSHPRCQTSKRSGSTQLRSGFPYPQFSGPPLR